MNPKVGLHIWFPKNKLQIRFKAVSEIKTGETLREKWDKVPYKSRISYGTRPAPGTSISTSFSYEKPANFERFCVATGLWQMHLLLPQSRFVSICPRRRIF